MKKSAAIIVIQLVFISSSLGARVGLKAGMNHNVLDPGDGFLNRTGKSFHTGIDVGFEIQPCFAFNITPQVKSSQYNRLHWPGTTYEYMNLFIPTVVSIKSLSTTSLAPYLGVGAAVNFQLNGKMIWTDLVNYGEQEIEDLKKDLYFVAIFGIEAKLARLRILPEFSFNYNLTDNLTANHWLLEDHPVSIYDFGLTIGLCYSL